MSLDSRISALERKIGGEGQPPPARVVTYDPREAPADPTERDVWFRSLRSSDDSPTFFIPDNGRGPMP